METTTSNSTILLWLAGAFLTAWNGLLSLILGQQFLQIGDLKKEIKAVSTEREDHCIPRLECDKTHKTLNDRFDTLEHDVKDGIKGIHARLDKIILTKRPGACDE